MLFLSHLREGESSSSWQDAKGVLERVSTQSLFGELSTPQQVAELLETIRKKLAEIALDPYQTEHLINNLEKLLKAVCNSKLTDDSLADCEMVDVEQVYPSIPGDQKTTNSSVVALDEQGAGNVEESFLHDVESIASGNWVEFSQLNGNLRARYIGTVGPLNKLIFVNRDGLTGC